MKNDVPQLLVADPTGSIFGIPDLQATGMKAGHYSPLRAEDLIGLPPGSRLFFLPDRAPVGFDPITNRMVTPAAADFMKGLVAVSAFMSPGYTATFSSSYRDTRRSKILPLYSYAAVALYRSGYHVAGIRVDAERRHDARFIDIGKVRSNISLFKKIFPGNRLLIHLAACALEHGCAGAQNFFLKRYEGPLPTSSACNAHCAGCISLQTNKKCPETQPRIRFRPTPEEVAEIALFHIRSVRNTVVSFGQGCDGEPLLAGRLLEDSIKLIRRKTARGLINMNTNASKPHIIARLFDAGLDSIRVSMNSARPDLYTRYYRPDGYAFKDVLSSISIAKKKNRFVSINYLTMPGFTDSKEEFRAFDRLIGKYRIDMVQWRNLNYDPMRYFSGLGIRSRYRDMLGIRFIMDELKRKYPHLMMGYYNPARAKIDRQHLSSPKVSV